MPRVDVVRPYVHELVKKYLEVEGELIIDDDGDIPIRTGSAVYYVTLLDREVPLVRIFSEILYEVPKSAQLFEELNGANAAMLGSGRAFWVPIGDGAAADAKGTVIIATETVAESLDREELEHLCWAVGSGADYLDTELEKKVGGRKRYADEDEVTPDPEVEV